MPDLYAGKCVLAYTIFVQRYNKLTYLSTFLLQKQVFLILFYPSRTVFSPCVRVVLAVSLGGNGHFAAVAKDPFGRGQRPFWPWSKTFLTVAAKTLEGRNGMAKAPSLHFKQGQFAHQTGGVYLAQRPSMGVRSIFPTVKPSSFAASRSCWEKK